MELDTFDVGARLKQVRTMVGLSQRALADRADISHGQISLIERNRISPSVATLRKVLGGIPMTMAEFFEPDHSYDDRVFFRADELVDLTGKIGGQSKDAPARILLKQVGNARDHNLQILFERYAPGADTGASMLEHNAHEGGIIIAGQIEVTVGGQKRILRAGEAYLFDSRVPHRFRNVGQTEAVVVSACSPPYL